MMDGGKSRRSRSRRDEDDYPPERPQTTNTSGSGVGKWLLGLFVLGLITFCVLLVLGKIPGVPSPLVTGAPTGQQTSQPISEEQSKSVEISQQQQSGSGEITEPGTCSLADTWFYKDKEICGCTDEDENGRKWRMKPVYKTGGEENVHWKYTDDPKDPSCLRNWDYYDANERLIQSKISSITKAGDTRNWCATNVYQHGRNATDARAGFRWDYC